MPIYPFQCPNGHEYEQFLHLSEYDNPTKCPKCKSVGKRIVSPRVREPSFTEKMFPYYDTSLNKIFPDKGSREKWLKEKGYVNTGGDHMTRKQERACYSMRQWGNNARHARQD